MIATDFEPAYRKLLASDELAQRAQAAYEHLTRCDLCAWECRVDRLAGKKGMCRTGEQARVSSFGPHLGEEDPLRGWRGSGTIFIARCNLRCQFCQNYEISQVSSGTEVEPDILAPMMLELQEQGCHNINIVSPSHIVAQLLSAILIAAQAGLFLPLVYNTGGYDSLTALALLDGVIDIYSRHLHPLPVLLLWQCGHCYPLRPVRRVPRDRRAVLPPRLGAQAPAQ